MRVIFCCFLLAIGLFTTGCITGSGPLDMVDSLPVYNGAYDIDKRKLGQKSDQQLWFRVTEAYPSNEVLVFYGNYLSKTGWARCAGSIDGWHSFVDATDGADQRIHQAVQYFLKEDGRKLAVVLVQYRSEPNRHSEPDNDVQNVTILMKKNVDLKGALEYLSIDCR